MTQSRFLEAPLIQQADGELKKILPKVCEFEAPKGRNMLMRPTLLLSTIWQFKFVKLRPLWKRLGSSIVDLTLTTPTSL